MAVVPPLNPSHSNQEQSHHAHCSAVLSKLSIWQAGGSAHEALTLIKRNAEEQ